MTIDERQQLTLGACTVFERAALARAQTPPRETFIVSEQAALCLRAWLQTVSPGDPAAFERRLGWDGLDLSTVTAGLSMSAGGLPEPDWLRYVEEVILLAPSVADELRHRQLPESELFDAEEGPPFVDLLVPALRVSRRARRAAVPAGTIDAVLSPVAIEELERQLLRDLSGLAALAMLEDFKQERTAHSESYAAFTDRMLSGSLTAFFLRYPVLAKQLAWSIGRWVRTTTELVHRLEEDRDAITREFGGGGPLGRVQSLEPALSDPHDGGSRVIALQFESGQRLIYKPRHVDLERVFGELVEWLASRGLEPRQRSARLLDRQGYGWMEVVDEEPFSNVDEVRRYYRQSGGLLCLAHVLRAEDLHMENVVATRDGPVLIDLELTLQPLAPAVAPNRPAGSAALEHEPPAGDNCLTSGLLTFIDGSERVFDMGGLRGTGRGATAIARRAWRALGTDAIGYVDEWTFETRVRNQVVLDGVRQRPDDYADEVCRGFEDAYRFLMTHRDELGAPDGPLSRFSGCVSRVLPRSSSQYGLLRYVLVRPQYLKDGCRWSAALDALNRTLSQARERPAFWPLVVAERGALEALDIPRFTVVTNETAIRAGGKPVMSGYFRQSGLSAVHDRLNRLSADDLRVQLDYLDRALHEAVHTRFETEPPAAQRDTEEGGSPAVLVAHAAWIGAELLRHSGRRRPAHGEPSKRLALEPAPHHHLYDGSVGLPIFLAALSVTTGDERWRTAARDAVRPLRAAVDGNDSKWAEDAIGGTSGLGSIVYGLTTVGSLLGDTACLELALRVAARLTLARVDSDAALDVTSGAAGAILGLLALHRETGEASLLAQAVHCGEHLCACKLSCKEGAAWRTADGRVFTGFAHGVAGIAYALGRLFEVSGDERFRLAAAEGYRYVASRFLPGQAKWPIIDASNERRPASAPDTGAATMTAWCHGAPGIGLAIGLASVDVVDAALRDQLDRVIARGGAGSSLHRSDHLCCGNLGRAEALLTVGRRLVRPDVVQAAAHLARRVTERARANGHFCLTSDRFTYRIWDPGFFRGLSGIGYALLRFAMPWRLPSVVAFEVPPNTFPATAPRPTAETRRLG
ncbi:MAG: type 2 lantipeptide synthetase LanM [Luteitalea sp.]|nr:type 2 lantipeptide synthetase LanM [Luteitalea sp.]